MSYSTIEIHYYGDGINNQTGVTPRQGALKHKTVNLPKKVQDYGDRHGYSSLNVTFERDHLIIKGGYEVLMDKDINGGSNEYITSIVDYEWGY